jgi:uncharacterized membrane protein YeaQ/YmgE (transglycosylase-associated protein family)
MFIATILAGIVGIVAAVVLESLMAHRQQRRPEPGVALVSAIMGFVSIVGLLYAVDAY